MYKIPAIPAPQHTHPPKRRRALKVTKIVVAALAMFTLVGVSISAYAVNSLTDNFQTVNISAAGEEKQLPPEIASFSGEVNLLVLASDTRVGQGEAYGEVDSVLADVIMLFHVNAAHDNATVVSFPRDLMVDAPSCTDPDTGQTFGAAFVQINSTLSRGGPGCTLATVEAITGMSIPFLAMVDFNGVVAMSNAIGGVEVCLSSPIDDDNTGIHLEAGNHTLVGFDAVQFLRTRYGVGDGSDLGRIGLQQVFLSALARKVKSDETLTNLPLLYNLARSATQNVKLSESLASLDTLVSLAKVLKDVELNDIVFIRVPVVEGGADFPGRVLLDGANSGQLFDYLKSGTRITISGDQTGSGSTKVGEDPSVAPPIDPATTADPSATAAPVPVPTPTGEAIPLNENAFGQKASDITCTQ